MSYKWVFWRGKDPCLIDFSKRIPSKRIAIFMEFTVQEKLE